MSMTKEQRQRQRERQRANKLNKEPMHSVSGDWRAVVSPYVSAVSVRNFVNNERRSNESDTQLLKPKTGIYFPADM